MGLFEQFGACYEKLLSALASGSARIADHGSRSRREIQALEYCRDLRKPPDAEG
jgi:hypothetical protein